MLTTRKLAMGHASGRWKSALIEWSNGPQGDRRPGIKVDKKNSENFKKFKKIYKSLFKKKG